MNDTADNAATFSAERHADGRFISTCGRPAGTRNKVTRRSVVAINDLHSLAFERLNDLVNAGHPETVRFVIGALIPAGGRAVALDDTSPEGLVAALSSGTISPAELAKITASMKALRELADIDELATKVTQLEALLKGGSV